MRYFRFNVTSALQNTIKNDIYFNIASARANDFDFVLILFDTENNDKSRATAIKILKGMNTDGRVKLFIEASCFNGGKREELYFRNKYPEMKDVCSQSPGAIVVKI